MGPSSRDRRQPEGDAVTPLIRLTCAVVLLVSACAVPGAGPGTVGTMQTAPDGSGRVGAVTSRASVEPLPSIGAAPEVTEVVGTPVARLRVGDVADAVGTPGSWTLDGRGSDAPWLPASALQPVHLRTGAEVTAAIGAWGAWIAGTDDPRGEMATWIGGRETTEPALPSVTVGGVEPGAWVMAVRLDRADGRGDATFYWLLLAD
jgi:hypothetical protein